MRHPRNGKRRYLCLNLDCPYETFSQTIDCPGRFREVKQQNIEMTLNGSGVRDIARVLHVSTAAAIEELKKALYLQTVKRYCTDAWGAYKWHLPVKLHEVGKRKNLEKSASI